MERKRELSLLYDLTSSRYDRRYSGIQREKYLRLLPHLPRGGRVLDVGCGTGLLLRELGKGAVGLDLSPGMLRRARRRNPGAPLVLADAEHLPFREGVFEAVLSVTVLQNLPHPPQALREMARVVREGGRVVVSTLRKKQGREVRGWMEEAGLRVVEEGEEGEDLFFVGVKVRGSGAPSS
jgi:ubiquinone/menaquinone biosynthesis C-methylase UbiE